MWFMWFPLFGTFWWILFIALVIAVIALEEHEYAGSAFGLVFAWLLIVTFLGDGSFIWRWISGNPWRMGGWTVVYFIVGLPWAAAWWWWKQTDKRREYDDKRKTFCVQKGICSAVSYSPETQIPDEHLADWQGMDYHSSHLAGASLRGFWTEHRPALICAMTWWPIHMGSFFFKDFLWSFWQRVLDIFGKVFTQIDEKVWGNVSEDFREVPDEHLPEHERENRDRLRQRRSNR